jgi:excinuclease ABC subunit C
MKVLLKRDIENLILKLKGAEQDDFAMLKEVLSRRFKRAILEKGNYLTLPDLILIDGGKGQYSSAKEVLDELGLHDLPMIAIAKGKFRNSGDETFFYNGKSLNLKKMIQLYFLCKDLEMKLIDLQLPLIEPKEQKDYQNHY